MKKSNQPEGLMRPPCCPPALQLTYKLRNYVKTFGCRHAVPYLLISLKL